MLGIVTRPGTQEKLQILSTDAQYDLACACGTLKDEHRKASSQGKWIYPITLPNGGRSILFKTLISNVCNNDCKYCPLREEKDIRRCSLRPEETADVFMDYYNRGEVFGLFLSSSLCGTADATMERLNATARILRKREGFKGYIHLKVIPGASAAAIEEAVGLASAVSLNIEVPGEKHLAKMSHKKDFMRDVVEPMKLISRLRENLSKYRRVKQTTQFIVGAAGESDNEIVKYTSRLYENLKLQRVYYSAYQREPAEEIFSPEENQCDAKQRLVREHRLYQVDFLMRRYGFDGSEIVFEADGNLSLTADPKEAWAQGHPEAFPVDVNRASREALLRVPGLGPVTVDRILEMRQSGRISSIEDIPGQRKRVERGSKYLAF